MTGRRDMSAERQTGLYIALLHLCLPNFGQNTEGAVPALLSAPATVSGSTSLPAACLLPSPYPGFIDLTLTTAEEVVWRLYIWSELDILETEYPAGTNAPCTVNIIHLPALSKNVQ